MKKDHLIWADQLVHLAGNAEEEGRRLAQRLFDGGYPWPAHIIMNLPPNLMTWGFFREFLQRVAEIDASKLDAARQTQWEAPYAFQRENIARWMQEPVQVLP